MANFSSLFSYLEDSIYASVIDDELLAKLIPDGRPLDVETALWDFKRSLPALGERPSDEERRQHKAEISDVIKDAVAFYNAHGGYIIFGVLDRGHERIAGCSTVLDVGDFNNRIESYTGQNIECLYASISIPTQRGETALGVLLIPKRPETIDPATFRKAAPPHASGKRAFDANDVYVRIRDQCRPATSDSQTWRFLHGPRRLENSGMARKNEPLRPMQVRLPARDPDLVKFIGRESYLSRLREWLSDRRSTVRLLTGIGGLGKTAIAYHFCEEIIETRAGEIEQLIWLTAKARTYSALRGKLVEVSRTDFSDAASLYKAILDALGSHPDWGDEDPSAGDVVEEIVQAISIYTTLVIIDDIDSLSGEDQREVVHTLSNASARTVTNLSHPSRILFTSRIDQGVSPTSVIKVEGFDPSEFEPYVLAVSATLGVTLPNNISLENFRSSTSGSPLFAASVIRLVRLGANLSDALERWRGQEGVDVRRFAFERELRELPNSAARLLYAVCLLGETTTLELSQALEISQNALGSALSSLQSFHLVVTRIESRAGAFISAPDDVMLTRDVLQKHLGESAKDVEAACASLRSRSVRSEQKISFGIAHVAALWRANENAEALIEAEKLHKEFPDSGDVTCLVATALTRPRIERWDEADAKFTLAAKQQCTRPELIEGWLLAKERSEDWTGLLALAAKTVSNRKGEDRPLHAYVRATEELIRISRVRHDRARRIVLAEQAVAYLARRMGTLPHSHPDWDLARTKKLSFARLYLDEVTSANSRPGDQIRIFDATVNLMDLDVYLTDIVSRGIDALSTWWDSVERREYIDEGAKNILKNSLARADRMERLMLRAQKNNLAAQIQTRRLDLAHRAAKLL